MRTGVLKERVAQLEMMLRAARLACQNLIEADAFVSPAWVNYTKELIDEINQVVKE